MKEHKVELLVLILAIIGIAVYVHKHMGQWRKNHPNVKARMISSVEVNGKKIPLSQVRVVQIPQEVYDSMKDNKQWAKHLTGDKKRVLMTTWDGCPYRRAFHNQLDKAFGKSGTFKKYYVKDVEVTGQSISSSCQGDLARHCPFIWIMNHCMGNICIINPITKEAIVDDSHDAKQILPLLMAYVTWTDTPLTEKRKTK